jgi:two-component system sensor histidine kinase VicK
VEDISKRKSLELALKKQYDNQETIMHMVAHDLKSPLHNIELAAGFLKENLEELLAKEKEKKAETVTYVDLISDTTQQALVIIDDLLLIGEIEAPDHSQKKVNLTTFIQTGLGLLSPSAQKKNIEIKFLYPNQPVYARVDPEKFQRALENLLSNAIKFSKSAGQVIITLKQEGDKALIMIQDKGIGIPTNMQVTIFNKFTHAGRIGTNGEPTTGLGLYIVKQIIEKYGGMIWVESEENVGTTFFIQLN